MAHSLKITLKSRKNSTFTLRVKDDGTSEALGMTGPGGVTMPQLGPPWNAFIVGIRGMFTEGIDGVQSISIENEGHEPAPGAP